MTIHAITPPTPPPAHGPFGATVDLLFLRDAIQRSTTPPRIALHVLEEAILIQLPPTMVVRLRLIGRHQPSRDAVW